MDNSSVNYYKCFHPNNMSKSLVTGEMEYIAGFVGYCDQEREGWTLFGKCGAVGKNFEPREQS